MYSAGITGLYSCIAASIAGAFSLIGLLISKEQRVSDFRQVWIDELRKDIAVFAAHALQVQSYTAMNKPLDRAKYWKETREDYVGLNQASMRIKLRLNQEECDSRLILQSMSEMEELFKVQHEIPDEIALKKIFTIISNIERNGPPLLKTEWRRVKGGERIYQFAKWGSLSLFVIAGTLACFLWYTLTH